METRAIPRTGELIPRIGLGTWQTFDVPPHARERRVLAQVLRAFLVAGGRVIDSSPMYGHAETVTGDLLAELRAQRVPFLATKVWTRGQRAGTAQMEQSLLRLRSDRVDLMQVHNLLDVTTHLAILRAWKAEGRVRYVGVTHYAHDAFPEVERLMRTEQLDFVQVPYSLSDRLAEKRLLPAALETGTAVLVMQPFGAGTLFRRVQGKPLPPWAADADVASWAQLFLKFVLGHPAVTCPIPATSKLEHLADNVLAGEGRLPDEAMRACMLTVLDA